MHSFASIAKRIGISNLFLFDYRPVFVWFVAKLRMVELGI